MKLATCSHSIMCLDALSAFLYTYIYIGFKGELTTTVLLYYKYICYYVCFNNHCHMLSVCVFVCNKKGEKSCSFGWTCVCVCCLLLLYAKDVSYPLLINGLIFWFLYAFNTVIILVDDYLTRSLSSHNFSHLNELTWVFLSFQKYNLLKYLPYIEWFQAHFPQNEWQI